MEHIAGRRVSLSDRRQGCFSWRCLSIRKTMPPPRTRIKYRFITVVLVVSLPESRAARRVGRCTTSRFRRWHRGSRGCAGSTSGGADAAARQAAYGPDAAPDAHRVGKPRNIPRRLDSERFPDDDELRVAVEDMPLPQFLHYVFGELLGVNYVIPDGMRILEAPVTLNLQESVSSRRLYRLVVELLAGRDIAVTFRDGVFYLHPVDRRGKGDVFIGFGARAEDVPDMPGPILQIIPLRYGLTPSLERTIRDLVDARVLGDTQQSALFVTGERFEILRVLDVVGLMDRPSQRGRYVGLVSLTYVTADEYMKRVIELLGAEGIPATIGAGNGSVALVSLESVGAVAVFAASRQLLDRVDYWSRELDRPAQGAERRYYIYTPRYARADEIGLSLVPLLGDTDAARVRGRAATRARRLQARRHAKPWIRRCNRVATAGAALRPRRRPRFPCARKT